MRKALIGLATLAAGAMLALPSMAAAAPTATAKFSFTTNKLGAPTKVVFNMTDSNADGSVPSPLTQVVAHLPKGMVVNPKGLGQCTLATLTAKGSAGCPASALIGSGSAATQQLIGTTLINESAAEQWFIGPNTPGNLLTGNIIGVGTTPIAVTVFIKNVLQRDTPPYGYKLVATIPPIPTVPGGPNSSIVSINLTTGVIKHVTKKVHGHKKTVVQSLITVPKSCPAGGFKWADDNTYADGSTTSVPVTTPCPKGSAKKKASKKTAHHSTRHSGRRS